MRRATRRVMLRRLLALGAVLVGPACNAILNFESDYSLKTDAGTGGLDGMGGDIDSGNADVSSGGAGGIGAGAGGAAGSAGNGGVGAGGASGCTDGDDRCSGTTVQHCSAGTWTDVTSCDFGCDSSTFTCWACDAQSLRCSNSAIEVCDGRTWTVQQSCPLGCAADRTTCYACTPNSVGCKDSITPTACNDTGEIVDQTPCTAPNPVCIAATGQCGQCTSGDKQCASSSPQVCDSGSWTTGTACSGSTPVCLGGTCVECDPTAGRKHCNGNTVEKCDSTGHWVTDMACPSATPYCIPTSGTCGCNPGSSRCQADGKTPELCENGVWNPQPMCSGETPECVSGSCVCSNAQLRCSTPTQPQSCSNGVYTNLPACSGDLPTCSGGDCVCAEGQTRCGTPTQVDKCTGGSYVNDTACSGDTPECVGGSCVCSSGQKRCSGNQPQTCANGVYGNDAPCSGVTSMCLNGACVNPCDPALGLGPGAPSGQIAAQYGNATVTRNSHNYIIQNNAFAGPIQTLSFTGVSFTVTGQTGSTGAGAPVSFPEVFTGANNTLSTAPNNMPKQVSALTTVPTGWSHNAPTTISGSFNATYDVWFSTSAAGDPGSPTGGYLMIWLYKPPSAQPIGSSGAVVTIGGQSWTVWQGTENGHPVISYVKNTSVTSYAFDLKPFISDASSRGVIMNSWYLTNIFAGFEIWSGGIGLKTNDFCAIVN